MPRKRKRKPSKAVPSLPLLVCGDYFPAGFADEPTSRSWDTYFPPVQVLQPGEQSLLSREGTPTHWCDIPMVRMINGGPAVAHRHMPLVCDVLRSAGASVDIDYHEECDAPLPIQATPLLADLAVAEAVSRSPTSLVRYRGNRNRLTDLVVQIAHAFPTESIAIIGQNERICSRIVRQLAEEGLEHRTVRSDTVEWDGRYRMGLPEHPVFVLRRGEISKVTEHFQTCQIIVLTDARFAFHQQGSYPLNGDSLSAGDPDGRRSGVFEYRQIGGQHSMRHRRLIGFLPATARLSPDERRRLFSRFGGREIHIQTCGSQAREVRFHTFNYSAGGVNTDTASPPIVPVGDATSPASPAMPPHLRRLSGAVLDAIAERDSDRMRKLRIPAAMIESLLATASIGVVAPEHWQPKLGEPGRRAATEGRLVRRAPDELEAALDEVDVLVNLSEHGLSRTALRSVRTRQNDPRPLHVLEFRNVGSRDDTVRFRRRRRAYRLAGALSSTDLDLPDLGRYLRTHPDGPWWHRHRADIADGREEDAVRTRPRNRLCLPDRPPAERNARRRSEQPDAPHPPRPPASSANDQDTQEVSADRDHSQPANNRNGETIALRLRAQFQMNSQSDARRSRDRCESPRGDSSRRIRGPDGYERLRSTAPSRILRGTAELIPDFDRVFSTDNLLLGLRIVQGRGGDAAGCDGLRPSDLCQRDAAPILELLGRTIREGQYRHGPVRNVSVRKASGGTRIISIATVVDRCVSRAAYAAIGPMLDAQFLHMSYGFRPRRSTRHLLADLGRAVTAGCRYLVIDDIRSAFDSIRRDLLQQDIERAIADRRYRDLVMELMRANQSPDAPTGIPQGDSIAPCLLNLHLHYRFDMEILQWQYPFAGRYVDNIVGAARTVTEARDLLDRYRETLATSGLDLKGPETTSVTRLAEMDPTDPTGNEGQGHSTPPVAELLGFQLGLLGDQLDIGLAPSSWARLECRLHEARDGDDRIQDTRRVLMGWIGAIGPALATRAAMITDRLHDCIDRLSPSRKLGAEVQVWIADSQTRWTTLMSGNQPTT